MLNHVKALLLVYLTRWVQSWGDQPQPRPGRRWTWWADSTCELRLIVILGYCWPIVSIEADLSVLMTQQSASVLMSGWLLAYCQYWWFMAAFCCQWRTGLCLQPVLYPCKNRYQNIWRCSKQSSKSLSVLRSDRWSIDQTLENWIQHNFEPEPQIWSKNLP